MVINGTKKIKTLRIFNTNRQVKKLLESNPDIKKQAMRFTKI